MPEANKTAATEAPKSAVAVPPAKAPAEKKPKAEPKPPKYAPTSTVHLLSVKDKEGFKYGPVTDEAKKTVNPKRANTKSAVWFANYSEGITVAQLAEKFQKTGGSMNSNLDWDIKHGFIEVRPAKSA